ncbi:MAG: S8 family serine peptidase [Chromatiales bacterium]|nr:S8 family serine peptidase [Chromatiales bacterium]
MRLRSTFPRSVFALAACALLTLSSAASAEPKKFVKGQILVQPKPGLSQYQLDKILYKHKGMASKKVRGLDVHIVEVPEQAEEAVARALSKNKNIAFAEIDEIVELEAFTPNDPEFASGWHHAKMNTPEAWDTSQGDGIVVAVCDTGILASHVDLAGQLVPGWNTASNSSDNSDIHGHGTKVAGVIAATTDNAAAVASVAWKAKVMPIRVTNSSDGSASISAIASCISWAADHGALIANASYRTTRYSSIAEAAKKLRDKGGLYFSSAGNDGNDPGWSNNPYINTISATNKSDGQPSWSNYGQFVDFSAPGVSIRTTTKGGGTGGVSGTSFSSPNAAAVAALVMAANPSLSPNEVEAVLQNTAVDLGNPGWDPKFGFGRLDAAAAVAMAANASPGDTTPPVVAVANPGANSEVSGLVPVDINASDNFGVEKVDLLVDGLTVATDTTAPFQFSWDSVDHADGEAKISARAVDVHGNRSESARVTVNVMNGGEQIDDTVAPSVRIESPGQGATVSGNVSLRAAATDEIGVTMLSITINGQTRCAGDAPTLSCSWNTRKLAAGTYTIGATAKDAAGNTGTTAISVQIQSSGSGGKGKGKGKGN